MSTNQDARDASTGRFVTAAEAAAHPDTTVVETRKAVSLEQTLAKAIASGLNGEEFTHDGVEFMIDSTDPTTGDGTVKVEAGGPEHPSGQRAIYFTVRVEHAEDIS